MFWHFRFQHDQLFYDGINASLAVLRSRMASLPKYNTSLVSKLRIWCHSSTISKLWQWSIAAYLNCYR